MRALLLAILLSATFSVGACAEFPTRPVDESTDSGAPRPDDRDAETDPGEPNDADSLRDAVDPDSSDAALVDAARDTTPSDAQHDAAVPDAPDARDPDAPDGGAKCTSHDECDDDVFCNGREFCNPASELADANGCVAGQPPAVDDNNACTHDACDERNRTVLHEPNGCACVGDPQDAPRDSPQCFLDVAVVAGLNVAGNKDGGLLWADFNADGLLDAATNTLDQGTLVFFQLPGGRFNPVTASHAPGLADGFDLRSILAADVNNDGWVDIVRNGVGEIDIYLNGGPDAGFRFGLDGGANWRDANPDQVEFNTEGMVLSDYNADGFLDVLVDAQNNGVFVLRNPGDGSAGFERFTGANVGFPTGDSIDGDYMTAADLDQDADVDVVVRKTNAADIWLLEDGRFGALDSVDFNAPNTNKGGVLLCDFDNDGDFDLFYSDGGSEQRFGGDSNRIYLYDEGTFRATDEPQIGNRNVDGVDCGDIDNDGDMDLFVTTGRADQLFINETDGELRFVRHDRGTMSNGDGEGAVFGDYDRDGDLDLWVNTNGGNQLFRNNLGGQNYLLVEPHIPLPSGRTRADHGATVWLEDEDGRRLTGVRTVSSGKGHGSQGPPSVHFGLPWGPWQPVRIRVRFVGSRGPTSTTLVPADLGGYQSVRIVRPD